MSSALIAGAGIAVASMVPILGMGCCLWMMGGGAFAVSLYRRKVPTHRLDTGAGARLGALTGLAGFILYAVFFSLLLVIQRFFLHSESQFRAALKAALEQSASRQGGNQQAIDMIHKMSTPEGMALLITLGMIMFFFAFLLFTTIGGALGASLFGSKTDVPPPRA